MKKRLLLLLFVVLFVLSAACTNNEDTGSVDDNQLKNENEQEPSFQGTGISISVKNDTLTPNGAIFQIENKGYDAIYFGEDYWVQVNNAGKWQDAELLRDLEWFLTLYKCTRNESLDFEVDWAVFYGSLPPATYRLVKPISESEMTEESYNMYCEFTIYDM